MSIVVHRRSGWRSMTAATGVELKLFLREPFTVIFTLGLPVLLMFVLGGVFGDMASTPEDDFVVYRGVGALTYYTPAYIAVVIASIGLISVPVHVASYRERGVLRRFRASAFPLDAVLGAQVLVAFVLATVGAVLVTGLSWIVFRPELAVSWPGVLIGAVIGTAVFASVGLMLGTLLPTSRAALGAGVLLWFSMLLLCGAGPPPEILTSGMRAIARPLPLTSLIRMLQDPWLGLGIPLAQTLVLAAYGVLSITVAAIVLRRN